MSGMALRRLSLILVMIVLPIILNGCTVIGYGIGSYIDSKTSRESVDPITQLSEVKPGFNIQISLKNGKKAEGIYRELGMVDDSVYAELYNQILNDNADRIALPELDGKATFFFKPAKSKIQMVRIFSGFEYVLRGDSSEVYVNYEYVKSSVSESVNLRRIDRIVSDDERDDERKVTSDELDSFIASGGLNKITTLKIDRNGTDQSIPIMDVSSILLPPDGKMKRILGSVGFITDAVIFALVRTNIEQSEITEDPEEE